MQVKAVIEKRRKNLAISNCAKCGKVFLPDTYTPVCAECLAKDHNDLKIINEYLHDYPLAGILEVATRTGVDAMQILRFVKSGSLRITDAPDPYKCRMCGKDLKKGTLCQDCMDKVADLKEALKKKKDKNPSNRRHRR
jgi:ribosomal protein L37AE/L43A